ncbi:aminopeptidase N [Natronosporangium hydrolyticum]|uniref:Aminopeptidase N n=1 Tax=Natronosporangium hydrolyticum TaxID=2811111 RepID=A0A895YH40_9ACTN|nr:aminopeptidase N [Natronosporangium hydrolyticum]QSB17147.1 aminopeptidase N [Natronosporangium hydrolyticum]
MRNLTQTEAIERARLLDVTSYDITVDLTTEASFRSVTEVNFRCHEPGASVLIEVAAEQLHSATLNGDPLDLSQWSAEAGLRLPGLAADNLLRIDADFGYSQSGQGLTRSVDPVDGSVYLHSQFEIADAQRVFACFDQPDLKSVYTWHVVAPSAWRVVSNSPIREVETGSDRQIVHFERSARMSTYITALCAGPLHEVRRSHDGIDLGYFCRASMAPYLDVDDLHETTIQGFDFFHRMFGIRYPLPKYDQLWMPDFNHGAMENFGCVVHAEALFLFRSQVTDAELEQRSNTILHELAHMWFGNLVTMRWWDDLWLNESFAEWAAHWCNAAATRYTDAWTTFLSKRKVWGYRQDQLSSTHPVYCDMPDIAAVEVNFDGITYAKGASVLKQLVAYVGEEAFVAGLRDYFTAHAWGNASFDDLLASLSAASGRALRGFATDWLTTCQVNTLRPELAVAPDGTYQQVTIVQQAPAEHPTLRTHRIAVGLYDLDDGKLVRRERLELDVAGERTEVPALTGVSAADLVLLNDDDLSYTKIRLAERSLTTVVDHLAGLASPLPRALCWAAAWDMLRDGELPARSWLSLALRALPTEPDINLVTTTLSQARGALGYYADPQWADAGWAELAATARTQAYTAAPGSGHQLAWARAFAAAAHTEADLATVAGWLHGADVPDGLAVDTELRWSLLQCLVAAGAAGDPEIDAALAADATAAGEREAATARALVPTAEAKRRVWQELTSEKAPANWWQRASLHGFWHPRQLPLTEPYVTAFHEVAADIYARRDGEQGREFLTLAYPLYHVAEQTLAASETWLADPAHPAPARRMVAEGRDSVRRSLTARAADVAAG